MSQETDLLEQIVEKALGGLGEHFDACEILCSRSDPEKGTLCIKRGFGNWFARQGMAHEFIGLARAEEIADRISNPEE